MCVCVCGKFIEAEAVFTKREMNIERNVNFLQGNILSILHTYFSNFRQSNHP